VLRGGGGGGGVRERRRRGEMEWRREKWGRGKEEEIERVVEKENGSE
jgi:hypothetical protein